MKEGNHQRAGPASRKHAIRIVLRAVNQRVPHPTSFSETPPLPRSRGPVQGPRLGHVSAKTADTPPEYSRAPYVEWLRKAPAPRAGVCVCHVITQCPVSPSTSGSFL